MVPRKRNLLEAFQSARHEPAAEQPPPAVEETSEPRGSSFSSLVPRTFPEVPRWLPWVVAVGLAFLFGVLIGRGTTDDAVEAADGASSEEVSSAPASVTPPRTTAPSEPAGRTKPGTQSRIQDSALFDPANLYTVVVATYDQQHDDLAWATVEHLRAQSLDPFPPVAWRDKILVLVGAAPSAAELRATEGRVRGLARDGAKPYHDDYPARIDSLIER